MSESNPLLGHPRQQGVSEEIAAFSSEGLSHTQPPDLRTECGSHPHSLRPSDGTPPADLAYKAGTVSRKADSTQAMNEA